jgi:excisionase family DNA binding protein
MVDLSGGVDVSEREFLTIEEVAERLRVKPDTVRAWLRQGRLQGIKAGRLWRIRPSAVEAFIQTTQPLTDPEET